MTAPPNPPSAPSPAIASLFHCGRHRRGVGEPTLDQVYDRLLTVQKPSRNSR